MLAAPTVSGNALIRNPSVLGDRAILPKYINRHATARIPIATNAQPARGQQFDQLFANIDCSGLVKRLMVAKTVQIQLE
jgi:hypothetical protein